MPRRHISGLEALFSNTYRLYILFLVGGCGVGFFNCVRVSQPMRVKTRNTFLTFEEEPRQLRRASTDPCLAVPDRSPPPTRFDSGFTADTAPKDSSPRVNPLKIFVGSLPAHCDEAHLAHFMSFFGEVTRVTLKRNQHTGLSRRYGYVKFAAAPSDEIFSESWSLLGKQIRIRRYQTNPCWKRNYCSEPDDTDENICMD